MRILTIAMLAVATLPLALPARDAVSSPGDDPPPGYKSMNEVKLAVLTGQLKLINPAIEVPANVEMRKDVEYEKGGGKVSRQVDYRRPRLSRQTIARTGRRVSLRGLRYGQNLGAAVRRIEKEGDLQSLDPGQ